MTFTRLRRPRLLALVATLLSACLLLGVLVAGLPLLAPRRGAGFTQQQAEQLAFSYVQANYSGPVTSVVAQPVTLGQLNGPLTCPLVERLLRQLPVLVGTDSYNPCDPNTPLWQVRVVGDFAFGQGYHGNYAEVIYTSNGEFIRAQSGTR